MPRRIALFANGKAGVEISEYLSRTEDEILILFLSGLYPETDSQIEANLPRVEAQQIFSGDLRLDKEKFLTIFNQLKIDTIITVYWPFLIPNELYNHDSLTVNFHPALLPQNRGWYPHVHNILDGSTAGVTLHKLSEAADEGDIWVQKEVEVMPWDLASDLYKRLQEEIVMLFKQNWEKISTGKIDAFPQSSSNASYHRKRDIENLDLINLHKNYKGSELINLLRSRTFEDTGYAYFINKGRKIRVKISFEPEDEGLN